MIEEPLRIDQLPSRAPLRLALVTETYPPEINGVAMTTGRLVEGLLRRRHQIQLIRPRQRPGESPAQHSAFQEVLAHGLPIPNYGELKMGLPAKLRLTRLWSVRRPDVVHVVTEGPLGWSALAAARKLRLPVVSDFHTNFHSYSRHYGFGWLRQPIAGYLRRFHNKADATLVPTAAMQDELLRQGYRNVQVVARGVDTALFTPARRSEALRASWGARPGELVAAYVGRIAREKNLQLLVETMTAIRSHQPGARLLLVGDGPARRALETDFPGCIFAGMRSGEDLAAHYASADLFLFPSLTETFGNVTAEALASGLPVVAYDYAAAAQLVRDGVNGLLAPCGDAAAFIAAALRLADDGALRAALRDAARASVEHLDWEPIVQHLEAAFEQAIRRHASRYDAEAIVAVAPD
jgi:glycosyltransferase involved in cell wall biosynthesis